MRKTVAVITGFLIWTLIWLAGNAAIAGIAPESFDDRGLTSDRGILAGILALSMVASVVAGVTQASVARSRVMKSGMALGIVLLGVGVAVQLQYWNALPVWYHLAFLALLLPMTLVGSSLHRGKTPAGQAGRAATRGATH